MTPYVPLRSSQGNAPTNVPGPTSQGSEKLEVTEASPAQPLYVELVRRVTQNEIYSFEGPLVIYQTRNTEGLSFFPDPKLRDSEEILSPDLRYNNMTKSQIKALRNKKTGEHIFKESDFTKDGSIIPLQIRKGFLYNLHKYFAWGPLENTFKVMVNSFVDGGKYLLEDIPIFFHEEGRLKKEIKVDTYKIYNRDTILIEAVKNHRQSMHYVDMIRKALHNCLINIGGDNITSLVYSPEIKYYFDDRLLHRMVNELRWNFEGGPQPVFRASDDIEGLINALKGFVICLHSLQGTKIEILSYVYNRSSYEYKGAMRVTYYDHFGLDIDDITDPNERYIGKKVVQNDGFKQFFILQHWNELTGEHEINRPKPFITMIDFVENFSGTLNAQLNSTIV